MRVFFGVLLFISILFPLYAFWTSLNDFAHNQYQGRFDRLRETHGPDGASAHFGLTAGQLAGLDEFVVSAYRQAVHDGYRLGNGYEKLLFHAFGIDALLFVGSVVGLCRCGKDGKQGEAS